MKLVSVTRKGQVTIPEEIRRKLGIGLGSKLLVESAGEEAVVMKKVSRMDWDELLTYCRRLAKEKGLTPEKITKSVEKTRAKIWKEKYENRYGG